MHGLGYEDENDVRYATQKVIDTKQYDKRTKEGVGEILGQKPKLESSQTLSAKKISSLESTTKGSSDASREVSQEGTKDIESSKKKSVDEILRAEKKPDIDVPAAAPEIDTSSLNKSLDDFSKKLKAMSAEFTKPMKGAPVTLANKKGEGADMWRLFNKLFRSDATQNRRLIAALRNLQGNKTETPLEADVVVNTLAKELETPPQIDKAANLNKAA